MFLIGVALFAAASIGCGFARSVHELILARALQGVGGALLVPGSLAIISAAFDEEDRGKAIGTWSGATAITTALGPVFGGWLIDQLFVACRILASMFRWRSPFSPSRCGTCPRARMKMRYGALDWQGALLVTLGLGGVVYGLMESSDKGWTNPRNSGRVDAGRFGAGGLCRRGNAPGDADDAARIVSVEDLQRRQFADVLALCGARRKSLFRSAQPDSSPGLFDDRRRRCAVAVGVCCCSRSRAGRAG